MVKYFEKSSNSIVNELSYDSSPLIFHGRPSKAILVGVTVYSCHEVFHDMWHWHTCSHHGRGSFRQLASPLRTVCTYTYCGACTWLVLIILVSTSGPRAADRRVHSRLTPTDECRHGLNCSPGRTNQNVEHQPCTRSKVCVGAHSANCLSTACQ